MTSNLDSDNIPLADDDSTEEITEVDILKLNLGSGNKAKAFSAMNQQTKHTESTIPYAGGSSTVHTTNSSSTPAQPSCKPKNKRAS